MTSGLEIVYWIGFAFFGVGAIVAFALAMASKMPTMKLKLLLVQLGLLSTMVVYGAMALGQGTEVRTDLEEVNWARAAVYAATHGFFIAVVVLSLDQNWGKAAIAFAPATMQMVFLLVGTLSVGEDLHLYWFIWSLISYVILLAFMFFWVYLPEGNTLVSNTVSWIVKIVVAVALAAYWIFYIIDVAWKGAWRDTVGVAALYMAVDVVAKVFFIGIYVLKWVDLWESGSGESLIAGVFKGGLPLMVGVHKNECENPLLNADPQKQSKAQMRLP